MKSNQSNVNVILTLDSAFLIEKSTFSNPFRIVIDLFKYQKSYTYQERLYIANFYAKVNKLEEAEREFAKIVREFPQNLEAYYHWGQLLIQQGKLEDAREKFNAVPQGSSYFQASQNSLAKLDGRAPVYPDSVTTANPVADSLTASAVADTNAETTALKSSFRNTFNFFNLKNYINLGKIKGAFGKVVSMVTGLSIWFWIIILVVILIVVLVIFDVVRFRKQVTDGGKKQKVRADNATKQNMVNKLLVDGWKEPEIARELMMSEKEAKLYVRQGKKLEAKRNKN
jgi:tetratricopeptide (TPR) repeat protein